MGNYVFYERGKYMKSKIIKRLIIPKNLNNWFKDLPRIDKEDIYKYWIDTDRYICIKAPEFVESIEYYKTNPVGITTSGR